VNMKVQRSFVIEFKQGRRKSRMMQAPSIWGDIDFNALTREVEAQEPALSGQSQPSAAAHEAPVTAAVASDNRLSLPSDSGDEVATSPPNNTISEVSAVQIATSSEMTSRAGNELRKPRKQLAVTSGRGRRSGGVSIDKSEAAHTKPQDLMPSAKRSPASSNELQMLEAENRHLKMLLQARLRYENQQLMRMLARFT
jgi:hypothetical protein